MAQQQGDGQLWSKRDDLGLDQYLDRSREREKKRGLGQRDVKNESKGKRMNQVSLKKWGVFGLWSSFLSIVIKEKE